MNVFHLSVAKSIMQDLKQCAQFALYSHRFNIWSIFMEERYCQKDVSIIVTIDIVICHMSYLGNEKVVLKILQSYA